MSHRKRAYLNSDSFEQMLNSTFSAKLLSPWCIHKSHAFEMEPLYWAARIITSSHITRLWTTQRHQNSFPAVATLSLDFCFLVAAAFRAPACRRFFTESSCVTHISTSSAVRRVCFCSSTSSELSLGYPLELSQSFS